MNISKELLSEVLPDVNIERLCEWYEVEDAILNTYYDCGSYNKQGRPTGLGYSINIYELAHKNLKQWAKLKNVFDIIDWSEEPEQIFKKAEELRNEIN